MKKKALLSSVEFYYDSRSGEIVITSKDPQVKKKPFRLTLSGNSSSYNTLFQLLKDQNLIDEGSIDLPSEQLIHSGKDTDVPKFDAKTHIRIGLDAYGKPFDLNLNLAPHTLISGGTGAGKTEFQRLIIAHAQSHPEDIELYGFDLKSNELAAYLNKTRANLATTIDEALDLTRALEVIAMKRHKAMEDAGAAHQVPMKAIYVVVDEFYLLSLGLSHGALEGSKGKIIYERFKYLSSRGSEAGIYLFLSAQRFDAAVISKEMKANFDNRILLGSSNKVAAEMVLGSRPNFGGALMQTRGRAIVSIFDRQKLVQISHFPKRQ